jgi:8-hydroxy-5-deazaflavin:NADPH oxidoreductase
VKIAVLGTGSVGSTLGSRWARQGHQVHFGSRSPEESPVRSRLESLDNRVRLSSWQEAVADAEVVLLAVPWGATFSLLESLGDTLDGKILIDCINPLNAAFNGLDLGYDTSASEEIARRVPQTHIVKAFNTVSAATMADPYYEGKPATLFYCGDNADAKKVVDRLAVDLDFQAVDAGPLTASRYLEPLAMLYIQLAMNGWGSNCAFRIVKR